MSVSVVYHSNCLDAGLAAFMICKVADILQVKYRILPAAGQNQIKEVNCNNTILIDLPITIDQIEEMYGDSSVVVVFDRKESTAKLLDGIGFYDMRLRTGGRLTVFNDGKTPSCKNVHAMLRSKAGIKLTLNRNTSDLEKAIIRNVLANPRLATWIEAVGRKDSRNNPTDDQLAICSLLSKERFLNRGFERLLQMDDREYEIAMHTELCAYISKREEAAEFVNKTKSFVLQSNKPSFGCVVGYTEAPGNLNTEVTHQILEKIPAVNLAMACHFNHKKHTHCAQFRVSHNLSTGEAAEVMAALKHSLFFVSEQLKDKNEQAYLIKTEDIKTMIVFMSEEMLNAFTNFNFN